MTLPRINAVAVSGGDETFEAFIERMWQNSDGTLTLELQRTDTGALELVVLSPAELERAFPDIRAELEALAGRPSLA